MTGDAFKRACELQAQAAACGFDWPSLDGVLDKIAEEIVELRAALASDNMPAAREELGDLLFVLTNLARRIDVRPGATLDAACDKFEFRFGFVKRQLQGAGRTTEEASLEEMEVLWQQAKRMERSR